MPGSTVTPRTLTFLMACTANRRSGSRVATTLAGASRAAAASSAATMCAHLAAQRRQARPFDTAWAAAIRHAHDATSDPDWLPALDATRNAWLAAYDRRPAGRPAAASAPFSRFYRTPTPRCSTPTGAFASGAAVRSRPSCGRSPGTAHSVSFTLDTYVHLLSDDLDEALELPKGTIREQPLVVSAGLDAESVEP